LGFASLKPVWGLVLGSQTDHSDIHSHFRLQESS